MNNSYTKPIIYYLCPQEKHRIDLYAMYKKDILCKSCGRLFEKAQCMRMRDYANGTRILRKAGERPDVGRYNHEYYLKRKAGLLKKQVNPRKKITAAKDNDFNNEFRRIS